MKLFLKLHRQILRTILGICFIIDGTCLFFTLGYRFPQTALKQANKIAKLNYKINK